MKPNKLNLNTNKKCKRVKSSKNYTKKNELLLLQGDDEGTQK